MCGEYFTGSSINLWFCSALMIAPAILYLPDKYIDYVLLYFLQHYR